MDANRAAMGAAICNRTADWLAGETRTTPHFINAYIRGNFIPLGGYGVVQSEGADPMFTNCTIAGNFGGVYAGIFNYVQCWPVFNNCIIWNNLNAYADGYYNPVPILPCGEDNPDPNCGPSATVWDFINASTTFNYCLVQDMDLSGVKDFPGLDATAPGFDPGFIRMPTYYSHEPIANKGGSFTLKEGSPCIDMGSDSLYLVAACGFMDGACTTGNDSLFWADEYTLTAPPYTGYLSHSGDFYGAWNVADEFSGLPAFRRDTVNNTIDIGAFEWWEPDTISRPPTVCRYVTQTGSGQKDGSSWSDASDDLQAMINAANTDDTIWVAAGTYHPTHSANGWTESSLTGVNPNPSDKNNAFVLKSGVKIFGGFTGNETDLDQRDWIANSTTLSGDFNNDDHLNDNNQAYSGDNAYHVVISANNGPGTELDGFTVRGGNIYDYTPDVTISVNGKWVHNKNGGGIYVDNSELTIRNLEVRNNAAANAGGGIYCVNSSGLRGYNLYVYKNIASQGGGMYVQYSPKFKNIVVAENQAGIGGGISNVGDWENPSLAAPVYINLLLHGNIASPDNGHGAGMQNENSSPLITNATIAGNYGGPGAAGVCNYYEANPVVNNSIIWNNISTWYILNNVQNNNNCSTTYNYSLVQDMDLSSSGGLDATVAGFDPLFISSPGCWLIASVGSFTLQPESPCVDAGNAALYQAACGDDFAGWNNETALTPPPYTAWNGTYMNSFFGAWYPQDDYSGITAPRVEGNAINIGAFEEIPLLRRSFMPLNNAETLQVFPSPVFSGDALSIALSETTSGEIIEVYSIMRQHVTQIQVPADTRLFETTLRLPPGYYILKWRNSETKLLVK